jgi:hypothetical protein
LSGLLLPYALFVEELRHLSQEARAMQVLVLIGELT